RIGLDFLPQLAHIDPQILDVARRAPDFLHQEPVGENLARVEYEKPEDLVFLGRKLHLLAFHRNDAPDKIDAKVSALEQRLAALLLNAVAQRGADARNEFGDAERLGDIIVRAEIEGLDFPALAGAA